MTRRSRWLRPETIRQHREQIEHEFPPTIDDAIVRLVVAQQAVRQAIDAYEWWRAKALR